MSKTGGGGGGQGHFWKMSKSKRIFSLSDVFPKALLVEEINQTCRISFDSSLCSSGFYLEMTSVKDRMLTPSLKPRVEVR